MRVGSLCSGYDGLGLALGGEQAWFSENDPNASKVLAHHWPKVPNLGDLTAIDWNVAIDMGRKRDHELAEKLYNLYCQGMSLAEVGKATGRTRQSVWDIFNRRVCRPLQLSG